jgi:Helix-turn-helix domain
LPPNWFAEKHSDLVQATRRCRRHAGLRMGSQGTVHALPIALRSVAGQRLDKLSRENQKKNMKTKNSVKPIPSRRGSAKGQLTTRIDTRVPDLPLLLSINDVSAYLRLSTPSIRAALYTDELPSVRIGNRARIPAKHLIEALNANAARLADGG